MPQDFSGQNLRGRSFKGQDLTGANFSRADIRGANFTDATLTGANFSYAKAGLQRRWIISLLIASPILSAVAVLISIIIGLLVGYFSIPNSNFNVIASIAILVVLAAFFVVTIYKGLEPSLRLVAAIGAVGAVSFAIAGPFADISDTFFRTGECLSRSRAKPSRGENAKASGDGDRDLKRNNRQFTQCSQSSRGV